MKNLLKKSRHFFLLFSMLSTHHIYGTLSVSTFSSAKDNHGVSISNDRLNTIVHGYCRQVHRDIPDTLYFLIRCALYGKPRSNDKNDLSEQNLSLFDFSGYAFIDTILTGTILDGAILRNTTCDFSGLLKQTFRNTELSKSDMPNQGMLSEYLNKLQKAYLKLNDNKEKAELLYIISSIACLPYSCAFESSYKSKFSVKLEYYLFKVYLLQQKIKPISTNNKEKIHALDNVLGSFKNAIKWSIMNFSQLKSDDNQYSIVVPNTLNIEKSVRYEVFKQYIDNFKKIVKAINSENGLPFNYKILKTLEGLNKAYPYIRKAKQEEAHRIASAFLTTYIIKHPAHKNLYSFYIHKQFQVVKLAEACASKKVNQCIFYRESVIADYFKKEFFKKNE